jgi:hydroxymethylbilane synthase
MTLRLGARGSALSLAQAAIVAGALSADGGPEVEIITVKTTGDRLSAAGEPIGWKGDFTRELDEALLADRIDVAVHSLKDVPAGIPSGLVLAAVPPREDPSDVLLAHPRRGFAQLPSGARVGTSSPRRRAQLLAARPDLEITEARGNVDTRIRRLEEGKWDAIVLARAGLARLGRLEAIVEVFPESVLLPAPAQGALGLVARAGDASTLGLLSRLNDPPSRASVEAERSFLAELDAGCRAPVAARARVAGERLHLSGAVFEADGSRTLAGTDEGATRDAASIGRALARRLLARGAATLMTEAAR